MKKTILTIMVAAMMLVAFTACEQPVPGLSKAIIDADIVQNGTFLVGQPFDASKFSVNVTYSDKSTGTLEGVNVVYAQTGTTGGTVDSVKNGDKVQVTLAVGAPNYSGNDAFVKDQTFEGSIVAYQIDSIEITAAPESYVYDASSTTLPAKDFTVVASYRDSNNTKQTVTMDPSEYAVAVALDDTAPTADDPADATATVTLGGKFGTNLTATVAIEAVVEATPDPEYTYEWDEESLAFALAEDSSSNAYIKRAQFKNSMVTIYKVLQAHDEEGAPVADTYKFEAVSSGLTVNLASASILAGTSGSTARFAESTSATVEYEYTFVKEADQGTGKKTVLDETTLVGEVVVNADGEQELDDATKTISIALRDDYPISFSATNIGKGGAQGATYSASDTPAATTDFNYTITWASTYTPEKIEGSYLSAISCSQIPADAKAGSCSVTLTYKIADATNGYTNSVTSCTASVTVGE